MAFTSGNPDNQFNLNTATNLFKIKYLKISENVYNSANVLLGRVKKKYDFTGKRLEQAVPIGFSGGVGSGVLPVANTTREENAVLNSKKVYARVEIDREAIKAAQSDEGAFVRQTKYSVQKGVESWMRNMSRILFNDGTGQLSVGDGATAVTGTGTSADPWVVTMSSASFKEANWEEGDFVDNDTTDGTRTTFYEVMEVDAANRKVSLAAHGGAGAPGNGDTFYMQNSKNNDPQGLKGVLDATSGTLYGVDVGRRWQAVQEGAGGAGLTPDRMNKVMLDVQRRSGKVPNLIITSFTQFRKLLNQLEDQKQYNLPPRAGDLKGMISFKGVEFMSSMGAVGVFPDRFCEDDRMYFLNDNYITVQHRPDFGWFVDDGTVFLRKADDDAYEARYGGYLQNYIVPSFHGVLDGLAT